MAKIAEKVLWWERVEDAVEYRIRLEGSAGVFSYDTQPYIVAPQTDQAEIEADLADGPPLAEGAYDIYITAVDAGGNESDFLELAGAVLDFVPPPAPLSGGFR